MRKITFENVKKIGFDCSEKEIVQVFDNIDVPQLFNIVIVKNGDDSYVLFDEPLTGYVTIKHQDAYSNIITIHLDHLAKYIANSSSEYNEWWDPENCMISSVFNDYIQTLDTAEEIKQNFSDFNDQVHQKFRK